MDVGVELYNPSELSEGATKDLSGSKDGRRQTTYLW